MGSGSGSLSVRASGVVVGLVLLLVLSVVAVPISAGLAGGAISLGDQDQDQDQNQNPDHQGIAVAQSDEGEDSGESDDGDGANPLEGAADSDAVTASETRAGSAGVDTSDGDDSGDGEADGDGEGTDTEQTTATGQRAASSGAAGGVSQWAGGGDGSGSGSEASDGSDVGADDPLGPPENDGFGMLSPGNWVLTMLWEVAERVYAEIEASVDIIATSPVGLPAPGDMDSPRSWAEPTNGFWPAIYNAMGWTYALGVLWLICQTALCFGKSPEVQRAQAKRLGVAWIMTLGMFIFAPLGLHLFGEAAVNIAPSGDDFMQSPEDFASFGFGVVLMAILLAVAAKVVAIGLISMFMVYMIAHLTVLFWPLMWPAWASDGQAQGYGATGIFLYGTVLVIGLVQAVILLALFNVDFTTSPLGPIGALVALIAGLLFALVYLPWTMLKQAHAGAAVMMGTGAAMTAGQMMKGAPAEVRNKTEQFREVYHDHFSEGEPRPRDVGSVGNTVASGGDTPRQTTGYSASPDGLDAGRWDDREQRRINRMYD